MSTGPNMKLRRSLAALTSLALVAGGTALLAAPANAAVGGDLLYGLTTGDALVTFRAESPTTLVNSTPITFASPLAGATNDVLGIDVRPATGELYALVRETTGLTTTQSRLYVVDPATGAATVRGAAITPNPTGDRVGFDFNPVPDRARIVTSDDQNLRVNPVTGGASANTPANGTTGDGTLAYAAGDANAGSNPDIAAAGYTNSVNGTTSTVLYDIDVNGDRLVRQDPPNAGTLNTVGSLGVLGVSNAGLDISPRNGTAYAALTVGTDTALYTVNLATGAASPVGTFGAGASAVAVEDVAVATPVYTATASGVTEGGQTTVTVTRRGDAADPATVTYALENGTGTVGADVTQASGTLAFGAGETSRTFVVSTTQDDLTEGAETFRIVLSAATVGAAGAPTTVTIADDEAGQAFGLTEDDFLTSFSVNDPATQTNPRQITGLVAGEDVVGIDVRPATGGLYAVGRRTTAPASSTLYLVNPATGAATRVGDLTVQLSGTSFGVDFNPVVDRLRIVSDTRQNLRVNPTNGVTDNDTALAYGDTGAAPLVTGAGYINSSSATPTATTLYDIDTARDALVTQNPANAGTLSVVGPLGIGNVDLTSGLDIAASGNAAFALLSTTGTPASATATAVLAVPRSLFRVSLETGAATSLGAFGTANTGTVLVPNPSAIEDFALVSTAPSTAAPTPTPTPTPSPSATSTAVAGRYHPVTPARILDTRSAGNTRVAAGADREVQVTGRGGIPSTGVSAVVLNVTVTLASARGDLQVYPTGQRPANRTSNLNYFAGETVPVQVQTGVGPDGKVNVSVNTGNAHVIVDVFGYYGTASDTVAGSSGYTALQPQRLLDTRSTRTPVVAGSDRTVKVSGLLGVPANATGVVLNTTVLGTPANADVQVYPTGQRPANRTSNLNVRRGQTKANSVTSALGTDGSVNLSVSQNSAQVILDVLGYYSADSRGRFIALTPARILDTRTNRVPVVAGADRVVQVSGQGGVPQGAVAAVLSVTGTGASNPVDLQVFPTGNRPTNRTSTINFRPGEAVANVAIATLGTGGTVTLSLSQGSATAILDVVGYITND